eukprot:gnl/MRDRNA2_/MRDRNA2_113785_c0_seq1.p1 gnl/MRDRNA2_/MRDRNA2_113785_c0~~gnl/MRDRNA2_/MRDRNA2_113785_c0_seq1.p1  ORF type:complete len:159 (-),score=6.64 gnl/MRDRNA2_/MRDRNA2_113785_c0_seq1:181-618(-)
MGANGKIACNACCCNNHMKLSLFCAEYYCTDFMYVLNSRDVTVDMKNDCFIDPMRLYICIMNAQHVQTIYNNLNISICKHVFRDCHCQSVWRCQDREKTHVKGTLKISLSYWVRAKCLAQLLRTKQELKSEEYNFFTGKVLIYFP